MTLHERFVLFDRWSETYDRSVLDESGVHDGYERVLEQDNLYAILDHEWQALSTERGLDC